MTQMAGVRPCINYMTLEKATSFCLDYFTRRMEDFTRVVVKPKKVTSSSPKAKKVKDEKITLTPEEFELLKKLGLC